jgi:hypothetical protein
MITEVKYGSKTLKTNETKYYALSYVGEDVTDLCPITVSGKQVQTTKESLLWHAQRGKQLTMYFVLVVLCARDEISLRREDKRN